MSPASIACLLALAVPAAAYVAPFHGEAPAARATRAGMAMKTLPLEPPMDSQA
eukprot:CAMPEP_0175377214 /NCGR_PEP_ID=MMETSP0095-20121207/24675_1 /TAXON_ID=311494 /ORGANISM="Alexandrium monilatum, Strain CCMP3105" /LENGTH=52 /DNA_ID=CAMNT_0016675521 /DNA_START=63 /DNA_END=218 /DNA_ORIENTATION=-